MKVFFSGFVQKRIKPISFGTVKTGKKQAEKTALEKTANLAHQGHIGLFGDIFTLNADYIAWKLLKMALEVEYMMEYQHAVC